MGELSKIRGEQGGNGYPLVAGTLALYHKALSIGRMTCQSKNCSSLSSTVKKDYFRLTSVRDRGYNQV